MKAIDAAGWLLTENASRGASMSGAKLHKLLFYAQSACLAVYGHLLFGEDMERWQYGPVCPLVYHRFSDQPGVISKWPVSPMIPDGEEKEILLSTFNAFGGFENWKLAEMVNEELDAEGVEQRSYIDFDLAACYYKEHFMIRD